MSPSLWGPGRAGAGDPQGSVRRGLKRSGGGPPLCSGRACLHTAFIALEGEGLGMVWDPKVCTPQNSPIGFSQRYIPLCPTRVPLVGGGGVP